MSKAYIDKKTRDRATRGGGIIGLVEQKGSRFSPNRKDLFGFGDYLVVDGGGPLLVQSTGSRAGSRSNGLARYRKIIGECRESAEICLRAGIRIEVWSWLRKNGRWHCEVHPVTLEDLDDHG